MTDKPSALSDGVRALVRDHVPSIEALETLLLLLRSPGRVFTAREVASGLGLPVDLALPALEALVSSRLVASTAGSEATYGYAPSDPTLDQRVQQLAAVYATARVEIIVLIASGAMNRVRSSALHTFSEAFRLRGKKKDG